MCKSPSDQQENSPQTSKKYEMCTEQEFGFSMRSKMGKGGHPQTLMVHQFQLAASVFLVGSQETEEIRAEARGWMVIGKDSPSMSRDQALILQPHPQGNYLMVFRVT